MSETFLKFKMRDESTRGLHSGRTDSILDFASHLQRSLSSESRGSSTLPDVLNYLRAFPLPRDEVLSKRVALDQKGTQLWNLCSKLDCDWPDAEHEKLGQIRALAFFMLGSAQVGSRKAGPDNPRLVHLGLAAAKLCLSHKNHEVASQILERVAVYIETPTERSSLCQTADGLVSSRLQIEYAALRMTLSWQQNRLDLAEHFFAQIDLRQISRAPAAAESILDLLFGIGKGLFDQKCCVTAVLWFERAYRLLQTDDIGLLSQDADELKLNLLHTYVRALIGLGCSDDSKLDELMATLLRDYGNRLVVRLLQLEMTSKQDKLDAEAYQSTLDVICTTIHLTEQNISMILHFVHQLRQHNGGLACRTLKNFLLQRLLPHENAEWTTKSFITLLWMSTTGPLAESSPLEIGHLFDDVFAQWEKGLSSEATHGALVLLWKRIEDNFNNGKFDETINWCQLARHKLLERAITANVDKVERKLVQCYLETFDFEACKAHVSQLLESKNQHPLNHYLAFCVALRTKDEDGARTALLALVGSGTETDQLLCACISKALASGTPEQAANILLVLLDTCDFVPPSNMSLPALLRCIIRLHLIRLDGEQEVDESLRGRVVRLFSSVPGVLNRQKAVSSWATRQYTTSTPSSEHATMDTTWFIVSCYQLAVKYASNWPAAAIISLLETVIRIVEHRTEAGASTNDGAAFEDHLRKCLSYFAITVIHVVEGRRRSRFDDKIVDYSKADQSATHFETGSEMIRQHVNGLEDYHGDAARTERLHDLASKREAILPLQLEAAIHQSLKPEPTASKSQVNPSRLCDMIAKAQQLSAPRKVFALFADIVLAATSIKAFNSDKEEDDNANPPTPSLPLQTASALLIQIIAAMRTFPDYDTVRASRWIRCLVQLCLDRHRQLSCPRHPKILAGAAASVNDEQPLTMVEDLVHQAVVLARQHQSLRPEAKSDSAALTQGEGNVHTSYPAEELEWLATTLFNLGVDFYMLFNYGSREGGPLLNSRGGDSSESDKEAQARKWTSLAVEIADVLALVAAGDQGLLARVLRRKLREGIGWVV